MTNSRAITLAILLSITILSSVFISSGNVSAQSQSAGSSITWETVNTHQYIDPQVSYFSYDYGIMQNVYEPLLQYNITAASSCVTGTGGATCVVPFLAQGYTASSDFKSYQFTLRSGIKFADGENLDSTAVYFSLNRLLVMDGGSPIGHAQAGWILQQLLNTSLSSTLCCAQTYNAAYVNRVLAENFVQITSPTTFTINLMNPNLAFPYLLAIPGADPVAPNYVMQQDLALWNQTSTGYTLPYPSLSSAPDEMTMIKEYYLDEAATCNSGITPAGCATTYLDNSYQGSMAGTGPYVLQSVSKTTNNIVYQANPNYWGGPYATKITPQYQTANINYVPDQATREIDLRNAATSGQALTVDITSDHLYDVADRNMWLNNGQIQSTINGVNLYGPYTSYTTLFDPFETNVTNIFTGKPYAFQPFADRRFRLAFADSVNMTSINQSVNNNLGQVALNVIPPGLPPEGSYNPSMTPVYSYNLDQVQSLLLDAMMNPLTSFNFKNGTAAPSGTFNNAFGCSTLNSAGRCDHPIPQTITIVPATGDTPDIAIMNTIAGNVNNVSATYNMGLTVSVATLPAGTQITEAFSGNLYMYALGWFDDYPWTTDFIGPMYAPSQTYTGPDGWNLQAMGTLFNDAVSKSSSGDLAGLVADTNAMNAIANNAVMYLWTFYPRAGWNGATDAIIPFTSTVAGWNWNAALGSNGPYFATLYPSTATTTSSAAGAPTSTLTMAAAAVVIIVIVAIAAVVLRSRSKKTKT